jgi:hypothetical protein
MLAASLTHRDSDRLKLDLLTMKTLLLFLLLPTLTFGQNEAKTYAETNPGVLKVFIDVSSDTAHLKSFIGKFDKNDISRLKTLLNNPKTLSLQNHSGESDGNTADQVESMLCKTK